MKVSELWLREWVNPSLDAQQLASLLTRAGLEVDAVNPVAGSFTQVVVAQVEATWPHPQADKLTLCEVNLGTGKNLKIVCGAKNVRPGLKVALAQMGASLPGNLTIKESSLRGELSQGMLCSASELGLAESAEGIMELEDDAPLGMNLRDYLLLNDNVFEIDLTPNRADCFSVYGIAREVAALTKSPIKTPTQSTNQPGTDESLAIQLQAVSACPHYSGRIIRGINALATTPLWLKERLRRAGLRPIHPVVDVTNYVMIELGQPMHAFNLQAIKGSIIVRFAREHEKLELLDGKRINLHEKVLIIADEEKPLAMAGVMGGVESAVQEDTTDIFLESAFFNPLAIAGVARRFSLCTDSSQRYERGVDSALPIFALERATKLLLEIAGGVAGPVVQVCDSKALPKEQLILFKPEKVRQLTGITVAEEEMLEILHRLGMQIAVEGAHWKVQSPSYRFDITQDVDLVEEVVRIYGYDKLTGQKIITSMRVGTVSPYEAFSLRMGQFFKARGYNETISYSFVAPELQQILYPTSQALELLNPISSELSQMRVGIWPGLLAAMTYNLHRQQSAIKFFESGVVFDLQSGALKEYPCIAGLITGEQGVLNWSENKRKFDYFDIKGDLEALFAALSIKNAMFATAAHPALHPGKSAAISIDGHQAGWCGVLHPRVADAFDVNSEVILFELRLDNTQPLPPKYQAISKYPQIRRDLSFLVESKISAANIENAIRQVVATSLLKTFDIFDVYTGENIPEGKKSLAVALTIQDESRTLVDSEINEIIDAIIKKLKVEFSITLRD